MFAVSCVVCPRWPETETETETETEAEAEAEAETDTLSNARHRQHLLLRLGDGDLGARPLAVDGHCNAVVMSAGFNCTRAHTQTHRHTDTQTHRHAATRAGLT